ncbi:MAG TPA: SRPBCC family protein [Candidatus Dormibacteraeota bacterium]|nr:SRPBCC family protein [Candidatus Dormibacteraeota bacterium]
MTRVREEVDIDAPAGRVWAVVQEDATNAPKWSSHVAKIEKLDTGPPAKGTRYRYHLVLPGGLKETLEVEQSVYNKPKKCAGKFVRGPLKGTWSYTYTEKDGWTHVVYDMDFQLTGLLRFAGGLLAGQYAEGIRRNMIALKKYIESGKGPKGSSVARAAKTPKTT